MICRAVEHWLWTSNSVEELPRSVQRHLSECFRCRRRREILGRLDEAVRSLPLPPSDPKQRAKLWMRLDQSNPLPRPGQQRHAKVWRWGASGIAAAALIGLVVWFGGAPPNSGPTRPLAADSAVDLPQSLARPAEDVPLICKVIGHNIRLAEADAVDDRMEALCGLAMSLKEEALERTRKGGTLGLPLLASLFEQVVHQGIVRQAGAAMGPTPARLASMIAELRTADHEVRAAAAQTPPVVADVLRSLADTSRDAAERLESGVVGPLPDASCEPPGSAPFLATLIHYALRLAGEADSLGRAALCSQLAEEIAPVIVLLSAEDSEATGGLGFALGDLLYRGVAGNLERAETEDPEGSRGEAIARVRQQAVSARRILEENLAEAPAKAQPGLKRAIEASGRGHDRVSHPGKAKGKPGPGKPDKGAPPPQASKPPGKPTAPGAKGRQPGGVDDP